MTHAAAMVSTMMATHRDPESMVPTMAMVMITAYVPNEAVRFPPMEM